MNFSTVRLVGKLTQERSEGERTRAGDILVRHDII